MKAIIEHFVVAMIAAGMAFVGYWLIGETETDLGKLQFIELYDMGWTVWTSTVSMITWIWLYRMCRTYHWLVLPVMGALSPLIGAVLFIIPYLWAPFLVIWHCAGVVFPTGIATGFLVSVVTLPFRPKGVLTGNAADSA